MFIREVSSFPMTNICESGSLAEPHKEKPHCIEPKMAEIFAKVFEDQKDFSPSEKMKYFVSWWKCWGGWQEPELVRKFDLELKPGFDTALRNPKFIVQSIKNMPSFTIEELKNVVSFLGLMSKESPTLRAEMGHFRSLLVTDDMSATKAGREIHRWLSDNGKAIKKEMHGPYLRVRMDEKAFIVVSDLDVLNESEGNINWIEFPTFNEGIIERLGLHVVHDNTTWD
jgi:hypothetical protein